MQKEDLIAILNRASPAEVLEMLAKKGKRKKFCPFILHPPKDDKSEEDKSIK